MKYILCLATILLLAGCDNKPPTPPTIDPGANPTQQVPPK